MIKKVCFLIFIGFIFNLISIFSFSEEIPRPSYDNSVIISFSFPLDTALESEVNYIKEQFGNGLFTELTFSSFISVDMDWHTNTQNADNGVQAFKNRINSLIARAKSFGVGIHMIMNFGFSREVELYHPAKEEDIRNAQWFNDNHVASQSQFPGSVQLEKTDDSRDGTVFPIFDRFEENKNTSQLTTASPLNHFVFTTLSRYARKLRGHTEAKIRAIYNFLKQKQEENPGILIITSAPGEVELNSLRQNPRTVLQEFFCDYSPFAILEFRDWIKHEGMYGINGKYKGEGYIYGGSRYQGANGLENFNKDFGTQFTTWDLKYFHWSLSDPVDTNYIDSHNPDPNIIPINNYSYGNMMPESGSNFKNGGFDPPREMKEEGEDIFADLWFLFRQTMVQHIVNDIAAIARECGFPKKQFYSHQIPADYLWGTNPNDPSISPNARFYSSASPLWTAKSFDDMGMGISMYDINFTTHFVRTSLYSVPAISNMSNNWGATEYNPEILVSGNLTDLSPVESIYQQIMRLYEYNAHFINFFKWDSSNKYKIKDNNRELAVKQFFNSIKDKGRQSIDKAFTPKKVENFKGEYKASGSIDLSWSKKIWPDLDFQWEDWGDFKEFIIYRGYTENFSINNSTEIARLTTNTYKDFGYLDDSVVYYKIAAANLNGGKGEVSVIGINIGNVGTPILDISQLKLNFGATENSFTSPPSQSFVINNNGDGMMSWTASENLDWLTCYPTSGINSGKVKVTVDSTGKTPGTYTGTITVTAAGATGSPISIEVKLSVYANGADSKPFGQFETPMNYSTVSSSIPVTGWVLDDIAIESVKIYRKEQGNLKYIGDAILVKDARSDIETAYPHYPNNDSAGWGYMMLTNFLPNNGNGTFTFYAIARDVTGHEVTLGTKTVTCDNVNAVKPFGALDTPEQGGSASGKQFINWGWALTPQPNAIPYDGSTIHVYIDGINIGHPVYNRYREDIATLFPGYANSNGAAGYFYLDTTSYANGTHTIAWIVKDNAGNMDGIGSRYFSIENNTSTSRVNFSAHKQKTNNKYEWLSDGSIFNRVSNRLNQIPANSDLPIKINRGYGETSRAQLVKSNKKRIYNVQIKELERVVIDLRGFQEKDQNKRNQSIQKNCFGFLKVGNQLKPLPIGSTLDSQRGIFYWQPGPGFLKDFQFVFVSMDESGKFEKKIIDLRITP